MGSMRALLTVDVLGGEILSEQQFQIQNVVKDTKGSMYLLARVLL